MVSFFKYHGLGNDFAVIAAGQYGTQPDEVARLCDRHRGVGADGIIFYDLSSLGDIDARMTIYNQDGSRPQMCGNGIRCLARHLVEVLGMKAGELRIATDAGLRVCQVVDRRRSCWEVAVNMGEARWHLGAPEIVYEGQSLEWVSVNMGNPHAVVFEPRELDYIDRIGAWANENKALFPEGVNVEFVRSPGDHRFEVVVYERGVGRTQACGTGACAVAVAAWRTGRVDSGQSVQVDLPGGTLLIEERDDRIWMTGEAAAVFHGEMQDSGCKPSGEGA
ncbi:MAG: diaminopimelate epimerase [Bradymonadaceae bacterium]